MWSRPLARAALPYPALPTPSPGQAPRTPAPPNEDTWLHFHSWSHIRDGGTQNGACSLPREPDRMTQLSALAEQAAAGPENGNGGVEVGGCIAFLGKRGLCLDWSQRQPCGTSGIIGLSATLRGEEVTASHRHDP